MQSALAPSHEPTASGVLDNLVKLSSTGDIQLLDHIFLESICELLTPAYAVLCRFTAKGSMVRTGRYRNPVSGDYEERYDQAGLTKAQRALIEQAQASPDNVCTMSSGSGLLAAHHLQNRRGKRIALLLETTSISNEQMIAFNAIKRIFHNFRDFMDESQRDPLTGLLNRRYFDDCIHRALGAVEDEMNDPRIQARRRAIDNQSPRYWLAILDIDHFKKFNDAYGHLYGDEILLLFARIMEQTFRESDLLFRFGGEEFIVITANADANEAMQAMERFRLAVQHYAFPQGGQVTVSCGAIEAVAALSATSLLGKADEALYYAKNHGRNQTIMYEELVASGEAAVGNPQSGNAELF